MCARIHEGPRSTIILGHYSTIFIYIGFQSKPELVYIATFPNQLTLSSLGRKCQAQSTLTWVSGDSNSGPRVCTCFHIWIVSPLFKCCSVFFFWGGGVSVCMAFLVQKYTSTISPWLFPPTDPHHCPQEILVVLATTQPTHSLQTIHLKKKKRGGYNTIIWG